MTWTTSPRLTPFEKWLKEDKDRRERKTKMQRIQDILNWKPETLKEQFFGASPEHIRQSVRKKYGLQ